MKRIGIAFFIFLFFTSCKVQTVKNIPYTSTDDKDTPSKHSLDIYTPKNTSASKEVFIFIHGGGWHSGKKDLYKFIGRRFAREGKVAVIINYRLSPKVQYGEMLSDCAKAIEWVYYNIEKYGGEKNKIFIGGHSAGGHLSALTALKPEAIANPHVRAAIKGCVLIDAFGLDIYSYLKNYKNDTTFFKTFSRDPDKWKEASPINYIKGTSLPFLIFVGEKTYPAIKSSSQDFFNKLKSNGNKTAIHKIKNKKHVGMILQMIHKENLLYKEIIKFMEE